MKMKKLLRKIHKLFPSKFKNMISIATPSNDQRNVPTQHEVENLFIFEHLLDETNAQNISQNI